jgi:hypothetical protein
MFLPAIDWKKEIPIIVALLEGLQCVIYSYYYYGMETKKPFQL